MPRQVYFVVGDTNLNAGDGRFVRHLPDIRAPLRSLRLPGRWTIVISIHGSEEFIADQARSVRGGQGAYDADAVTRIFGEDRAFVRWRDEHGPTWVVLNACQVSADLEGAIIRSLTRRGSGQAVQGMGTGCRPSTIVITVVENHRAIRTRSQYDRLPDELKNDMLTQLSALNREWGYFGAPPVRDDLILDYYFNEEPRGGWAVVRVSHQRRDTSIPFYNRRNDVNFLRLCGSAVGTLPQRVPSVPP
ncbi:MAG: hypothetical protein ABSG91_22560 [Syntrophobacteraceae bacterium]|jgi:hypothetical protein